MTITPQNVKLYESQRLTDEDDGGGRATGNEIVDGNINNLFPDISRLDRTIGDVALRKAFVGIDTNNADVYLGAHAIIVEPPADPLVSVVIFDAGTESDTRLSAQNRVESYVVKGARATFELLGSQYENQRQIVCIQREEVSIPSAGDVFLLQEGANEQYVRVTDVEEEMATFAYESNGNFIEFDRRRMVFGISAPLDFTFTGGQPTPSGTTSPNADIFTTEVADAARYWGSKRTVTPALAGDLSVKVDNLFLPLVPSSQTEQPILDRSLHSQTTEPKPAASAAFTDASILAMYVTSTTLQLFLKRSAVRGSVQLTLGGSLYTDGSNGVLNRTTGSNPFATLQIDYALGAITGTRDSGTGSGNISGSVTYLPGLSSPGRQQSHAQAVVLSNRGYNWVASFTAVKPMPGTMVISYMALGKWYEVRDNGTGQLTGAGSGSINFTTGSVLVSLLALPDVGTSIIYSFYMAVDGEYTELNGTLATAIPEIVIQLQEGVAPFSVVVTYTVGGLTKTLTDQGNGTMTGTGGTGTINYAFGIVTIKPNFLHDDGTTFNATYSNGVSLTAANLNQNSSGTVGGTMGPGQVMPGSFSMTARYFEGAYYRFSESLKDNGLGAIIGGRGTGTINYATGAWSYTYNATRNEPIISYYTHHEYRNDGTLPTHTRVAKSTDNIITTKVQGWAIRWRAAGDPGLAATPVNIDPTELKLQLLTPGDDPILANSLMFSFAGSVYFDKNGVLYKNHDSKTGAGVACGGVDYQARSVTLETWPAGAAPGIVIISGVTASIKVYTSAAIFRTPSAPVRPLSVTITATDIDGNILSATSDEDGEFNENGIFGTINYESGIIDVLFTTDKDDPQAAIMVQPDATYNAVLYSFLPLDANLIGIDPVRLPSDGKVPIFREGDVVVMSHTATTAIGTPTANQTVTLARDQQASIVVYDSLDRKLDPAMYTADREAGTVHFVPTGFALQDEATNPLTPPMKIKDRIEHMSVLNDIEITGELSFNSPLAHDYPATETVVSTALLWGDLNSRVWAEFTQKTWNSGTPNWTNARIGDDTTAQYNNIDHPIEWANNGAVTEKWALWFYSSSAFYIVGEQLGVIGQGNITTDCAPVNHNTGNPYFVVRAAGWGIGWATNNVLRFNTDGCLGAIWLARTVLSGPSSQQNDQFTLQVRGDAD